MLTEIYIEALLVDEDLADQVWEAWDKGEIGDQVAWWMITLNVKQFEKFVLRLGDNNNKAKPAKRRGRKAAGPRFLRYAMKDPKIAWLSQAECLRSTDCANAVENLIVFVINSGDIRYY